MTTTPTITNTDLTSGEVSGTGTFDILMKAVNSHLEKEYAQGRIKGTEYSEVYLGSLNQVLAQSVAFLLERDKRGIELEILALQKEMAELEKEKTQVELEIARVQLELQELNKDKITAETRLINQNADNAVVQKEVLEQQVCKLKGEFDLLVEQKNKVISEIGLLNQKKATEQAQVNGAGVDPGSVIGKQMNLYQRQADGFLRNSEQKAAKMLIDTWSVRRTTDEGEDANATNRLNDVTIGKAIEQMLTGVGVQDL